VSLSDYFDDLNKAYRAELEDLQSDSEGKNVLSKRLAEKRAQFAALLPMMAFAPEMVAPVFHGGVSFNEPAVLLMLSYAEPEEFPDWDAVRPAVQFEAWAVPLVAAVLAEADGERFLLTAVCLEFLHAKAGERLRGSADTGADADEAEAAEEEGDSGEREGEDQDQDLEEAGSDWLAEQGFDRRG
jgi:hypothetical protein